MDAANLVDGPAVDPSNLKQLETEPVITEEIRQEWIAKEEAAREARDQLEKAKKENGQKACAQCPGFCCLAFAIVTERDTPKKMREGIPVKEKLIADLHEQRERRAVMDLYYHRRQPRIHDYLEQSIHGYVEAIKESVIVADMLIRLKTTSKVGKNWRTGKRDKVYTCKHFQVAERRCGIYETRPGMCRNFYCETASEGRPPDINNQLAHPDRVPSVARKLPVDYVWEPLPKPPRKIRVGKTEWPGFPQDSTLAEEEKCV